MSKVKVSVIVPVYNVDAYLKECLDSIISQTFNGIEFICIDDGSLDKSLDILNEYSKIDKRIRVISKPNEGYGKTMNLGIDISSGEYIGILESDDFVFPSMYEDLYNIAHKNNCDVIKADWYNYWTKNRCRQRCYEITKYHQNKGLYQRSDSNIIKIKASLWSGLYKKEFIIKNNIRFLETPGAAFQDTSFSFKVYALAKRLMFVDRAYLNYRQDREDSSINNKEKIFDITVEYDEITKFLNKNPVLKKKYNASKLILQYQTYKGTLKRIAKKYRSEFVRIFARDFKQFFNKGEITKDFYKKVNKKEFLILLENPEKYLIKLERECAVKNFRKKIISVKIKPSTVRISILGKEIISLG